MNNVFKIALFLLMMGVYRLSIAQVIKEDTATQQPFFAAKKFNSKFYVGFEAIPTQILKTKAAMILGFSGNWMVNHKYVVSTKYSVLTSPVNIAGLIEPMPSGTVQAAYQSAGLGFSYIFFHDKKFSLQPELSGGWAYLKYEANGGTWNRHFGVITPAVYGVYNATKHFRFGVGLNYRATIKGTLLKDSELSGVGGVVFMRVGTF